jgi:hypothetical protein
MKANRHATFADSARNPLDDPVPDIPYAEDAWNAGFQREGLKVQRPGRESRPVQMQPLASRSGDAGSHAIFATAPIIIESALASRTYFPDFRAAV